MPSKKAFLSFVLTTVVLVCARTAFPIFYPWDECKEFQDAQSMDDSIFIKKIKNFCKLFFFAQSTNDECPFQQLLDDMLIVIAHNVINIDTFDDQGFLDKKSDLDTLLNFARVNKSLRKKILEEVITPLIHNQNIKIDTQSENSEIAIQIIDLENPETLIQNFKSIFGYRTYKQYGTEIIHKVIQAAPQKNREWSKVPEACFLALVAIIIMGVIPISTITFMLLSSQGKDFPLKIMCGVLGAELIGGACVLTLVTYKLENFLRP